MVRERGPVPRARSGGLLWGIRLRHILLLGVLGGSASWAWPRSAAAWELRNQAVKTADYALCMIGPSGPRLLVERPEEFKEQVRQRVVAAQATERPLSSCAQLASDIGVSHASFRLHSATAESFVDYQNLPYAPADHSLADLDVSLGRLKKLGEDAWPFLGGSPLHLVKPSTHAKEARLVSTPQPSIQGSGLPARRHLYRSTVAYGDTMVVSLGVGASAQVLVSKKGGIAGKPGGTRLSGSVRDRCVGADDSVAYTLSTTTDGKRLVLSHGGHAAPQAAVLSTKDQPIAGISCDDEAFVAALVEPPDDKGRRAVRLRICPFRKPCHDLAEPPMGSGRLYYPVDIARLGGDTVIARVSGGITRVTSSRDNGATWVPWTVVADGSAISDQTRSPFRLLVVGDRVLLYAGAEAGAPYQLLISDDHGASFRAQLAVKKRANLPAVLPTSAQSRL